MTASPATSSPVLSQRRSRAARGEDVVDEAQRPDFGRHDEAGADQRRTER